MHKGEKSIGGKGKRPDSSKSVKGLIKRKNCRLAMENVKDLCTRWKGDYCVVSTHGLMQYATINNYRVSLSSARFRRDFPGYNFIM